MISKQHRFHGHGSLNFAYRKGRQVRDDYMSLRVARSRNDDYRMAVVVSKKVSKLAVTRNRIRRRVYEVVRLHRQTAGGPWPYDLIFTVFDDRAAHVASADLTKTIGKLIQKSEVENHRPPVIQ